MRALFLVLLGFISGCGSSSPDTPASSDATSSSDVTSSSEASSADTAAGFEASPSDAAACKETLASFLGRVSVPTSGHPYSQGKAFCASAGLSGYIGATSCSAYEGANFPAGGKMLLVYYRSDSGVLVGVFDYDTGECLAGANERCDEEIGIGVDCSMK